MDKLWNDLPQGAPDIVRKGSTGSCPKQHLRPGIVRQLSLMETDKEEASGSEMWEPNFAGTPREENLDGILDISPISRGCHRN